MTAPVDRGTGATRVVPALDGVRGLAVFLVVFFHLRPDVMPGGWVGMSVFFPLSGYLITRLLLAEVGHTREVDLRQFWIRRARRLLPALYVLLAAVGIALVVDGVWTATDGGASLSSLFYVNNWWQLSRTTDYWAQFNAPSAFEHLWSLSVEEQFYVVWPIVVFVVARRSRRPARATMAAAGTIAIAGFTYGLLIPRLGWGGMTEQYYNTFVRAAELLSGGALAAWYASRTRPSRTRLPLWLLDGAGVAVLLAIVVTAMTLDGTSESFVANGGMFVTGLGTVLLIVASERDGAVAGVLGAAPMRWMGTRCYSLYLWHWPIIVLVTTANTGVSGWSLTLLRTAFILSVSVLSYWLVEEPIRRGRRIRAAWA